MFDSFELLVAPEVAQVLAQRETGSAAQQVRGTPGGLTQGGGATTAGGDLNCEDITERNFAIDPNSDPNGFDGDNDGIDNLRKTED